MKISPNSKNAISSFKHLFTEDISDNKSDGNLSLFLMPFNGRNFNYNLMEENLLESIAEYALSWRTREKYKNQPMKLGKMAREKFRETDRNKGELGEFLLFCFLEGHLEAPKLLTKLELKTSNNMYVNGADGIHILKISNDEYQLIFGESKTYKKITVGLTAAFKSISGFHNNINDKGNRSNGIEFEKGLISNNLDSINQEDLDDSWQDAIKMLTYPSRYETFDNSIQIDDAFAIFIGYEIDIEEEKKSLSPKEFRIEIEKKVKNQILEKKKDIYKKIENCNLLGYSFYIYVLPFTDLEEKRNSMLKGMID